MLTLYIKLAIIAKNRAKICNIRLLRYSLLVTLGFILDFDINRSLHKLHFCPRHVPVHIAFFIVFAGLCIVSTVREVYRRL